MIFNLVALAFLTLAAADLQGDLSSASGAMASFFMSLNEVYFTSTGSDVPTSLTSDYQSFTSAFSSLNEALEGVGADDISSGSTRLYRQAANAFYDLDLVVVYLGNIAELHANKTGNIFSFMQEAIEGMNEPAIQLVERANSIMAEDCDFAVSGYGTSEDIYLLSDVSTFSSRFNSAAEYMSATVSSLPNLSCLNGAGSHEGSSTPDKTTTASTSRGEAGSSSKGATSVSTDGAPMLAMNAGFFALVIAMLL